MDGIIKDIRYAMRGLMKRPAFTAVALIRLGLASARIPQSSVSLMLYCFVPCPMPMRSGSSELMKLKVREEWEYLLLTFWIFNRRTTRLKISPATPAAASFSVAREIHNGYQASASLTICWPYSASTHSSAEAFQPTKKDLVRAR